MNLSTASIDLYLNARNDAGLGINIKQLILAAVLTLGLSAQALASDDEAIFFHCSSNDGKKITNVWIAKDGSWFGRKENKRSSVGSSFWKYDVGGSDIVILFEFERLTYINKKDIENGELSKQMNCFPSENPFTN